MVVEGIEPLAQLDDDWDGDGGVASTPAAVRAAIALLRSAVDQASQTGVRWINPAPAPTGDGGVALSWHANGRNLLLIVHPDSNNQVVSVTSGQALTPVREVESSGDAAAKVVEFISAAGARGR